MCNYTTHCVEKVQKSKETHIKDDELSLNDEKHPENFINDC